jgi:hypothetical protein
MKKVSLALLIATSLAVSASPAFAATPKPHVTGGAEAAEGTANHEMSESSGTQKAEGSKIVKKATKSVIKKKKKM